MTIPRIQFQTIPSFINFEDPKKSPPDWMSDATKQTINGRVMLIKENLFMPAISGVNPSAPLFRQLKLTEPDIVNVMLDLLYELKKIKDLNLVHQNIKPPNILFDPLTKEARLIGYDTVTTAGMTFNDYSTDRTRLGAVLFMSPEKRKILAGILSLHDVTKQIVEKNGWENYPDLACCTSLYILKEIYTQAMQKHDDRMRKYRVSPQEDLHAMGITFLILTGLLDSWYGDFKEKEAVLKKSRQDPIQSVIYLYYYQYRYKDQDPDFDFDFDFDLHTAINENEYLLSGSKNGETIQKIIIGMLDRTDGAQKKTLEQTIDALEEVALTHSHLQTKKVLFLDMEAYEKDEKMSCDGYDHVMLISKKNDEGTKNKYKETVQNLKVQGVSCCPTGFMVYDNNRPLDFQGTQDEWLKQQFTAAILEKDSSGEDRQIVSYSICYPNSQGPQPIDHSALQKQRFEILLGKLKEENKRLGILHEKLTQGCLRAAPDITFLAHVQIRKKLVEQEIDKLENWENKNCLLTHYQAERIIHHVEQQTNTIWFWFLRLLISWQFSALNEAKKNIAQEEQKTRLATTLYEKKRKELDHSFQQNRTPRSICPCFSRVLA